MPGYVCDTGGLTEQLRQCQGMYVIKAGGVNSLRNAGVCMLYRRVE